MKSPVLLRKTLYRTKHLVRKTYKDLKSFLYGDYQKLPKAPFVNPFFSANNSSRKMQELDDFYRVFSEQRASHLDELQKGKKEDIASPEVAVMEDGECSGTLVEKEKINMGNYKHHEGKSQEEAWCHRKNGSSRVLIHRMKEFEMFNVDDVDHQLDIEEVLHYYSRLTCPVFAEIVDNFFMDMYSEFVLQEPSVSVNNSTRRLGPLKLSA